MKKALLVLGLLLLVAAPLAGAKVIITKAEVEPETYVKGEGEIMVSVGVKNLYNGEKIVYATAEIDKSSPLISKNSGESMVFSGDEKNFDLIFESSELGTLNPNTYKIIVKSYTKVLAPALEDTRTAYVTIVQPVKAIPDNNVLLVVLVLGIVLSIACRTRKH